MTFLRVTRREFVTALGGAVACPLVARAQQTTMPTVGFVDVRTSPYEPFVQGLKELGFVDHRNVVIDHREASEVGQLPAIAVELVRNDVAVISAAISAIVAAKAVTSTRRAYLRCVGPKMLDPEGAPRRMQRRRDNWNFLLIFGAIVFAAIIDVSSYPGDDRPSRDLASQ